MTIDPLGFLSLHQAGLSIGDGMAFSMRAATTISSVILKQFQCLQLNSQTGHPVRTPPSKRQCTYMYTV